jgi:hypothetical protein
MAETGGAVSDGQINPWFKVHERAVRLMSVLAIGCGARTRVRPGYRHGYSRPSYYDEMGDDDA